MKAIKLYVDEWKMAKLQKVAKKRNLSIQQVIANAVKDELDYCEKVKNNKPIQA